MSISSRSRNGVRNLNRRLNRSANRNLNRRLSRFAATLAAGARRPRRPNDLAAACRLLNQYLRCAERMAKRDPHLFGPHAERYFQDTLRLEQYHAEIEAAVAKVYGPPGPGEPARVSTVWTDRYEIKPRQRRMFLQHFHENYH